MVLVCLTRKTIGVSSCTRLIVVDVWLLVFSGFRLLSFNLGVGWLSLFPLYVFSCYSTFSQVLLINFLCSPIKEKKKEKKRKGRSILK